MQKNKIITQMANPITYLNTKTPPFLIFHGAKDTIATVCQSEILLNALISKGLSTRLIIEEDGVHSGTEKNVFSKKLDIMTEFIFDQYKRVRLKNN